MIDEGQSDRKKPTIMDYRAVRFSRPLPATELPNERPPRHLRGDKHSRLLSSALISGTSGARYLSAAFQFPSDPISQRPAPRTCTRTRCTRLQLPPPAPLPNPGGRPTPIVPTFRCFSRACRDYRDRCSAMRQAAANFVSRCPRSRC